MCYISLKYLEKENKINTSDELELINYVSSYLASRDYDFVLNISSKTFDIKMINELEDQKMFFGLLEIKESFKEKYNIVLIER